MGIAGISSADNSFSLADYAAIKNGSYKKLMKSYHKQEEEEKAAAATNDLKPEINEWKKGGEEPHGGRKPYDGVVYEKSADNEEGSIYNINKMPQNDRTAVVEKMKADAREREQQMLNLVQKTLSGQLGTFGKASGDNFWKTLAGGNYTVDAATKAQAQKDIGEDGYWGVKQTSKRLFDFASALAGDDVDKMKDMQKAMEKGFKLATKAWGRELPKISQDTLDAANKLFEDYYRSKEQEKNVVEV